MFPISMIALTNVGKCRLCVCFRCENSHFQLAKMKEMNIKKDKKDYRT